MVPFFLCESLVTPTQVPGFVQAVDSEHAHLLHALSLTHNTVTVMIVYLQVYECSNVM